MKKSELRFATGNLTTGDEIRRNLLSDRAEIVGLCGEPFSILLLSHFFFVSINCLRNGNKKTELIKRNIFVCNNNFEIVVIWIVRKLFNITYCVFRRIDVGSESHRVDFVSGRISNVKKIAVVSVLLSKFSLNNVFVTKIVRIAHKVSRRKIASFAVNCARKGESIRNLNELEPSAVKELVSRVCRIFCFFDKRLEGCDCINVDSGYEKLQTLFAELFPFAGRSVGNKIGLCAFAIGLAVIAGTGVRGEILCRDDKPQIVVGQININKVFPLNSTRLYGTAERPIVFCKDSLVRDFQFNSASFIGDFFNSRFGAAVARTKLNFTHENDCMVFFCHRRFKFGVDFANLSSRNTELLLQIFDILFWNHIDFRNHFLFVPLQLFRSFCIYYNRKTPHCQGVFQKKYYIFYFSLSIFAPQCGQYLCRSLNGYPSTQPHSLQ